MVRGKGEGSIYKRKSDGLWCATLELPPRDGKRRRKTVTGHTKNDVISNLTKLRVDLETHGDLPTEGQTVAQWFSYWLESLGANDVRPKTLAGYKSVVNNHILPTIGKVRLDKLTAAHIRRVTDRITSTPKDPSDESKGFLSATYALNAHRVMSSALTVAEREGRVRRNVAKLTNAPRKAVTQLEVLTTEEAANLVRVFDGDTEAYLWATFLFTGARRGELLGLTWDRVTDVIDLSWQLQRYQTADGTLDAPADYEYKHLTRGLFLTRPKSSAGWRIIPLVEPLAGWLEHWRAIAPPNDFNLVFTKDGEPIDPDYATKKWPKVLAAAGIMKHLRLHDIRHTTVDLLYEAGVPEPLIVEICGWSTVSMARHYKSRGNRPQLTKAMLALSELLAGEPAALEA